MFPSGRVDEILDSRVSRYHELSGNASTRTTLEQLFGKRVGTHSAMRLHGLSYLADRLSDWSVSNCREILEDETALPIFSRLLSPESFASAERALWRSDTVWSANPLLHGGRKVIRSRLRLCPMCVAEDISASGAYWRRSHQLHGVPVCHLHGCDLVAACPSCQTPVWKSYSLVLPTDRCRTCNKMQLPSFSHPQGVQRLARLAYDAMRCGIVRQHTDELARVLAGRFEAIKTVGESWQQRLREHYGDRYMYQECGPRMCSMDPRFGHHDPHESQSMYLQQIGSFRRLADLLVSVDQLFESWDALDAAKTNIGDSTKVSSVRQANCYSTRTGFKLDMALVEQALASVQAATRGRAVPATESHCPEYA